MYHPRAGCPTSPLAQCRAASRCAARADAPMKDGPPDMQMCAVGSAHAPRAAHAPCAGRCVSAGLRADVPKAEAGPPPERSRRIDRELKSAPATDARGAGSWAERGPRECMRPRAWLGQALLRGSSLRKRALS